jgi:uncharacterized protein YycO
MLLIIFIFKVKIKILFSEFSFYSNTFYGIISMYYKKRRSFTMLNKTLSKSFLIGTLSLGLLLPGASGVFASQNEEEFDYSVFSKEQQQELKIDLKEIEKLKDKKVDQAALSKELDMLKEENPEKYNDIVKTQGISIMTAGEMGTYGDILITYDSKTSGWEHGHAAIVQTNNDYIVEAWPNVGVRSYQNNWANRFTSKKKMYVSGAPSADYTNAQTWAKQQLGDPYSIPAGKNDARKFYCSSLVWQAWYNQGYNLDANGGLLVTPADLENDSSTIVY